MNWWPDWMEKLFIVWLVGSLLGSLVYWLITPNHRPICDSCGRRVEDDGQVTADTVLCGNCIRRLTENQ